MIRACTPLLTPFMLVAPSYPCPRIFCISTPQSPSASRNFVANASLVVQVSASTNVKKSSQSSSFLSCVLRYLSFILYSLQIRFFYLLMCLIFFRLYCEQNNCIMLCKYRRSYVTYNWSRIHVSKGTKQNYSLANFCKTTN